MTNRVCQVKVKSSLPGFYLILPQLYQDTRIGVCGIIHAYLNIAGILLSLDGWHTRLIVENMLKLSAQDKAFIINKHQQGWKTCVIKQQLSKRRNVHVSYTTVYHVQKSFDAGLCDIHGTNVKPKRKRVPPVVTPIVIKLVKELLSKKPEQSAPVICQILRDNYNLRLSLSSTKLAINQAGFKGRMVMRVSGLRTATSYHTTFHLNCLISI